MARTTSLDKFLSPNYPALELNGWKVSVSRESSGTLVYCLDEKLFIEAVGFHQEKGVFEGSRFNAVVGYVGVFDYDGSFSRGEYLQVAYVDSKFFTDDDESHPCGYYLRLSSGRKAEFSTMKTLLETVTMRSPEYQRRRAEEQAAKSAAEAERRNAAYDQIRGLSDLREVDQFRYTMKARRSDAERKIRNALESLISRSQEVLDLLDNHPNAHIASAFLPDGRLVEEFLRGVAAREEILVVMQNSPFYVLFEDKEATV